MVSNRNYFFKSSIHTARLARLIAKLIDLFIVTILSVFLYPYGIFLALIYLSVAAFMQGGQSVGKKFMGMKVISLEDGSPCSLKQSFKRNLPFIVPLSCTIVPVIGWLFAAFLGLALISLELILLFKLDSGHRLGDVMADTSVVTSDYDMVKTAKEDSEWFSPKKEPT